MNDITTLHIPVRRDTAARLRALAGERGLTAGALLRSLIAAALGDAPAPGAAGGTAANPLAPKSLDAVDGGWLCRLSDENAARIKARYARDNPQDLSPDALVNEILTGWFRLMSWARDSSAKK